MSKQSQGRLRGKAVQIAVTQTNQHAPKQRSKRKPQPRKSRSR